VTGVLVAVAVFEMWADCRMSGTCPRLPAPSLSQRRCRVGVCEARHSKRRMSSWVAVGLRRHHVAPLLMLLMHLSPTRFVCLSVCDDGSDIPPGSDISPRSDIPPAF
jgi:hypothetical protein